MRSSVVFIFLMALLLAALTVLFLFPDSGVLLGMTDDEFGQLSFLTVLALAIASTATLRNAPIRKSIRDIALWIGMFAVLIIGYSFKEDASRLWSRVKASLVPGQVAEISQGTVLISRGQDRSFIVQTQVNGNSVSMVFDTGADAVVLAYEAAEQSGYDMSRLRFNIPVSTANGTTRAASVEIGEIRIGSITRENISGLVAQKGDLRTSLLGLTFTNTLTRFGISGDQLTLVD